MPAQKQGKALPFFVYFLYRILETFFTLLPLPFCYQTGKLLGLIFYYLLPHYRKLSYKNLSIAFGEENTERERKKLAKGHFKRLGANLFSSIKVANMSREKIQKCVTVEGKEHFLHAQQGKKGILVLISHLGNWEIISQLPSLFPNIPLGTLYQPIRNPYLNAYIKKKRARLGVRLFDRRDGFFAPTQLLRKGGALGVLVDQHAGERGVWCPFFNKLASTSTLASLLAERASASMLTLSVYTTGIAKWKIVIEKTPPLEVKNTKKNTAQINLLLEKIIRRSSEDWFWVHERWKTPNPNFLLSRYQRGVTYPPGFNPEKIQAFRILLRSPNWLGDACMAIPTVRAIKQGRPDIHLTILSPEGIASLWENIEEVDAVISRKAEQSPFQVAKILRAQAPFEAAILFPNSLRSALEVFLAKIPCRIGYTGHFRRWLINRPIEKISKQSAPQHHYKHYLRIAQRIGANIDDTDALLSPIAKNLPGPEKETLVLGVCPGAAYGPAKRWPLPYFAETMRVIHEEHPETQWRIFGSPKETLIGEELTQLLEKFPRPPHFENRIGKTSLTELLAELKKCHVLLTNDTGTMHLAAALGVPTVSLFGSTEPSLTRPLGKNHRVIRHHTTCSPCFLRECPIDFRCMHAIPVSEVTTAVLIQAGKITPTQSDRDKTPAGRT